MPQIAKGGKYIFGWSRVREDGSIQIPDEALEEYGLIPGENVILSSGSKSTGGFVISKKEAIQRSKISVILDDLPELAIYRIPESELLRYKGRLYGWTNLKPGGILVLSYTTLLKFDVKHGDLLLAIRGSHMGLVMGAKGIIIEAAKQHPKLIIF